MRYHGFHWYGFGMVSPGFGVVAGVNNRVYLVAALALFFVGAACGQGPAPPETASPSEVPSPSAQATPVQPAQDPAPRNWRYVNSGWVAPVDGETAGAFAQELRAFVITSQQEFDAYNAGFTPRRSRGTAASLARIDFGDSILLAAYYLWRPVQGDPLSVVGFAVNGNRATVELDMEDQPQGKLRPYLLAPMTVVVVDKDMFPAGETVEFVFELNGRPAATVTAAID